MNRWKASAIHLSISAIIALIAAAVFLLIWYPPPYFTAAGADELVLLLVGVDVCLGPLLTLIVFKPGKRGLRFDLTCIGIVQSIAFVYGLNVVLDSRPIFLVGVKDRFVLVSANEISDDDLANGSAPEFRSRSWTGPRLVSAHLPADPVERNALISEAFSGRDVQNLPKYYAPFAKASPDLLAHTKSVEALKLSSEERSKLVAWMGEHRLDPSTARWLPLVARKRDCVMFVDPADAAPKGAIVIDPW